MAAYPRKSVPADRVRVALVGCGRIAQAHLDALAQYGEAELVAVVDTRRAAGAATAEERRCAFFEDYRDPRLLESLDAVIICTPPASHHEIARHFLEQRVHVLCEKPLTITADHARELFELSEHNELLMMMASKFRYVDDMIKAKAIVESGILGNVVLYENTFCGKAAMKDRWNSQRELAGGGVLIDNGSHSVDVARYLLGPIRSVQAEFGIPAQGLEVEDTARVQFRTERGVIGQVDLSWSVDKSSDYYISVFGSEGTLQVGWKGSRYRQDGVQRWVPFGTGYDKLAAFRSQIGNFVGSLLGTQLPLIDARDALASVQVIEAAYRAAGRDNWIPIQAEP